MLKLPLWSIDQKKSQLIETQYKPLLSLFPSNTRAYEITTKDVSGKELQFWLPKGNLSDQVCAAFAETQNARVGGIIMVHQPELSDYIQWAATNIVTLGTQRKEVERHFLTEREIYFQGDLFLNYGSYRVILPRIGHKTINIASIVEN